jgi:hypothetical protein
MVILRLVCLLSDWSPQDKIMSLACKSFLTFLCVRSAAIGNSVQRGLVTLRLVCLLSDWSQDKIMSLACKLFLTFLCVRSAAIGNSGQRGLSREKGLQNPKPRPIRTTDGLRKVLHRMTWSSENVSTCLPSFRQVPRQDHVT